MADDGMSRRLQLAVAATCVVTAIVAAACGGTARNQSGGIGTSGASLVNAGALAYVAVDSDLGSSQWQKVDSLLKKFPVRDRFISELKNGLADQHIDYEHDVKPALGPEHFVKPRPGLLVLFPAYMWHGVEPFAGDEKRLSVAFDVLPG